VVLKISTIAFDVRAVIDDDDGNEASKDLGRVVDKVRIIARAGS